MARFTAQAEAWRALMVVSSDRTISTLLAEWDPKALSQVNDAITALAFSMSPLERLSVLPAYTEVMFAANGSKMCRGMVRDLPGLPRRITNLDCGTEFFADADTEDFVLEVDAERLAEAVATGIFR